MGTEANPVYDDEQTGISLSKAFNDTLALTFNFIRMENAYFRTFDATEVNALGIVKASKDVYTLEVPITTDLFNVTPWGAVAFLSEGKEINPEYKDNIGSGVGDNELAYVGDESKNHLAYYGGLTSKIKLIDGLNFGVDIAVSDSTMQNGAKTATYDDKVETFNNVTKDVFATAAQASYDTGVTFKDTSTIDNNGDVTYNYTITTVVADKTFDVTYNMGYLADAYISYDLPFMTIGLNGWYASGDKINLTTDNESLEYGALMSLNGSWGNGTSAYFEHGGLLNNSGVSTPAGTLGGGLTLKSAVIPKVFITGSAMYLMGTNEYINTSGEKESLGAINFLTTNDSLLDLGASASYNVYDNFKIILAGNYLIPNYDGLETDNAFVLGLGIDYIF